LLGAAQMQLGLRRRLERPFQHNGAVNGLTGNPGFVDAARTGRLGEFFVRVGAAGTIRGAVVKMGATAVGTSGLMILTGGALILGSIESRNMVSITVG